MPLGKLRNNEKPSHVSLYSRSVCLLAFAGSCGVCDRRIRVTSLRLKGLRTRWQLQNLGTFCSSEVVLFFPTGWGQRSEGEAVCDDCNFFRVKQQSKGTDSAFSEQCPGGRCCVVSFGWQMLAQDVCYREYTKYVIQDLVVTWRNREKEPATGTVGRRNYRKTGVGFEGKDQNGMGRYTQYATGELSRSKN